MKTALPILVFLLGVASSALAHPVSYGALSYAYPGETDRYTLHAIAPSRTSDDDPLGRERLGHYVQLVRTDAEAHGYINPVTEAAYRRELALLEDGKWIVLFITREGESRIEAGYSIAIRWDASPLPFEQTFAGRGVDGAPTAPYVSRPFVATLDRDPHWIILEDLNHDSARRSIRESLYARPGVTDEIAEVKFLAGEDPNPRRHLVVLHTASRHFSVHRGSRVPVPREQREEFERWVTEGKLREWFLYHRPLLLLPNAPEGITSGAFSERFYERLFEPAWEPHVQVRQLFAQVSGPAAGDGRSARARLFTRALGFPQQAQWSFTETKEVGTPGIRTEIFRLTVGSYEDSIAQALKSALNLFEGPLTLDWVREPTVQNCSGLLLAMESDLLTTVW